MILENFISVERFHSLLLMNDPGRCQEIARGWGNGRTTWPHLRPLRTKAFTASK